MLVALPQTPLPSPRTTTRSRPLLTRLARLATATRGCADDGADEEQLARELLVAGCVSPTSSPARGRPAYPPPSPTPPSLLLSPSAIPGARPDYS